MSILVVILGQEYSLILIHNERACIVDEVGEVDDDPNLSILVIEHDLKLGLNHVLAEPAGIEHISEDRLSSIQTLIPLEELGECLLLRIVSEVPKISGVLTRKAILSS
jgi:hypothetical protein